MQAQLCLLLRLKKQIREETMSLHMYESRNGSITQFAAVVVESQKTLRSCAIAAGYFGCSLPMMKAIMCGTRQDLGLQEAHGDFQEKFISSGLKKVAA